MTTTRGSTFATTMRVIDGVHDHTAYGRTYTTPAAGTCFAKRAQVMFLIRYFTESSTTVGGHFANFT